MADRERLLAEFGARLRELRARSGRPSYSQLTRLDPALRRSTVSDVLNGKTAPTAELVRRLVGACRRFAEQRGLPVQDCDPGVWHARWTQLRRALDEAAAEARQAPAPRGPVPRQLPPANRLFAGRTAEFARLTQLLRQPAPGTPTVVVIDGLAGCGKTALALRWAHDHAERFPDGQLYARLGGTAPVPPARILDGFLHAVSEAGAPSTDVPEQLTNRFRSAVAERRLLLVLDDAADAAQVAALLPASGRAFVLVTSRTALPELALDPGAHELSLRPLDTAQGLEVLRASAPERVAEDPAAARRLVGFCGGLPLALRLVGYDSATGVPLGELARRLESRAGRLGRLGGSSPAAARLREVIASSGASLPAPARRQLAALAAVPTSEVHLAVAAAAAGTDCDTATAALARLEAANLVDPAGPQRYRLHELVRAHLADLPDGDRGPALARVLSWYLHTAHAAARLVLPQRGELDLPDPVPGIEPGRFADARTAAAWYEAELGALPELTRAAAAAGDHRTATLLPTVALSYFDLRKPWTVWLDCFAVAQRSAELLGDRRALAGARNAQGIAHRELRRFGTAREHFERAAAAYREVGERVGAAMALNNVGTLLTDQRCFAEATARLTGALALLDGDGTPDRWRLSIVLNNLAGAHALAGEAAPAVAAGERALRLCRELEDAAGEGCALAALGEAWAVQGELDRARALFEAAAHRSAAAGDDYNRARTQRRLAEVCRCAGDRTAAHRHAVAALEVFERLGDPSTEQLHRLLLELDGPAG